MDFETSAGEIDCMSVSSTEVICNGTSYFAKETDINFDSPIFWVFLSVYVALVIFAGIASGLTLGLLSLDTTTLSIISNGSDSPKERKQAKALLPIIKRHHLLLVTLLLANAAAAESMPIFLNRISDPLTSVLVSVTAVLLFGEVIPQALCSRFGTAIGYYSIPLLYFLMGITFVISWPLSKLLDYCLGSHHGTYYKRSELGALVDILTDQKNEENPDPLSHDERLIIKGALLMRNKAVKDTAYTKLDDVYMIDYNAIFDDKLSKEVLNHGKSRVPLYMHERSNIVGLILVKFLVGCNPADEIPMKNIFMSRGRTISCVSEDCPLYDVLGAFQDVGNHLAVVTGKRDQTPSSSALRSRSSRKSISFLPSVSQEMPGKPDNEIVLGIITLEDVLEELLQEEILDEADKMRLLHRNLYASIGKSLQQSQKSSRSHKVPQLLKSKSHDLPDERATTAFTPLLIQPQLTRQQSADPIISRSVNFCNATTSQDYSSYETPPAKTPHSPASPNALTANGGSSAQATKVRLFRKKREKQVSQDVSSFPAETPPPLDSLSSTEVDFSSVITHDQNSLLDSTSNIFYTS